MKLIDLSHTFNETIPVYPGDPSPEFVQVSYIETKGYTGFQLKSIMHVGTHIDAPFHMLENGKRLSEIPIEKFFGKGILLDARGKANIDVDLLKNLSVENGAIVLIFTGRSKYYGKDEYYKNRPEITESFAYKMVEYGVKIVGMDTPGPDRAPYNIHKILLSKEVLIIENLTNLEALVGIDKFEIVALPPKMHIDGAPIRVVAKFV